MQVLLAAALMLVCSSVSFAQDTRADQLAAEQAQKATDLHPYEPTPLERRILRFENALLNPPPVYVYIGSVMRGGLLAAGPGFRGTFGDSGRFDMHGAWSLKNYKTVDGSVHLPELADGRVRFDARATWLDAPGVSFYGVGDGSSTANRATYRYRTSTAGGTVRVQVAPGFTLGAGVDAIAIDSRHPAGSVPVEELFTTLAVPGLGAHPTYTKSQLFAEVDWRQSPGYTRRGGLYRVEWNDYREREDGRYSFRRMDAEVNQFIPLLRENWVIALRALASLTDTDAGHQVPYFLMPDLGGGRELRGYPSWRFRDRNRLLTTVEYRWTAGQFVDMALFLDAGKVVARRSDVDLEKLRTTYGIGVRFHTPAATVMRIEFAHAHEGNGLVFAFGPSF